MIVIGAITVVAKACKRLQRSNRDRGSMQERGEKPNNYDNKAEWLLKGTRCNINYNQCETYTGTCIQTHTHTIHTHTDPLLTCFARPFSQVASYLLPLVKCSTPLPWNIPSFISPSYLVPVGKVYSPFPSILKKTGKHTTFIPNIVCIHDWTSIVVLLFMLWATLLFTR